MAASLRIVVEEYFAALTTADPSSCQQHAAAAQRSMDAAGQIAGALGVDIQQEASERGGFAQGLTLGAIGGWLFGPAELMRLGKVVTEATTQETHG